MKKITKNTEPQFFIDWKARNSPQSWEELQNPKKGQLREHLVEEQGYICCYCNRAINADHTTKIEHLLPQDQNLYPEKRFDYDNLLASCDGGERDKKPHRMVHCDARKSNQLLPISPLNNDCESQIRFLPTGEILPQNNNPDAQQTIAVLGLDIPKLNLERQSAIEPYINGEIEINSGADIQKEIDLLNQKTDEKYAPFCSAIISVLESILP